jgi:hypothetical protein
MAAGVHPDFKLPEGLGFYIAPSNCPTYYANHFYKLAEEPNAEFTEHWAFQDTEFIPTLTFSLMATRKLKDGEQIFVNYGPSFADLEPFVTSVVVASPEEEEKGDTTEDGDSPKALLLTVVPPTGAKGKKQRKAAKRKQPLPTDDSATPVSKNASIAPGRSSGSAPATPPSTP